MTVKFSLFENLLTVRHINTSDTPVAQVVELVLHYLSIFSFTVNEDMTNAPKNE